MPLKKPIPSEATRRALIDGIADFAGDEDPLAAIVIQAPFALHVNTLGLEDISSGVKNARSAGWRFLAVDPTGAPIAADVIEPVDGAPRMVSLSRDPILLGAIAAIRELETFPQVRTNDYELQVLRIPGALTETFWLKSPDGKGDLIIPVLTNSPTLPRMSIIAIDEFFAVMDQVGRSFSDIDNTPETG